MHINYLLKLQGLSDESIKVFRFWAKDYIDINSEKDVLDLASEFVQFPANRYNQLKAEAEAEEHTLRQPNQSEGLKYDEGKVNLSLLSSTAIIQLGQVLTFGERKYAAHNWRKGILYSRVMSACLRHIFTYLGGEKVDSETGLSHLAHAMCCLMFLLEYDSHEMYTEFRDLYTAPQDHED